VTRRILRRLALAPLLSLAVAGSAFAEAKQFPLDKAFPYLEGYLKLPPAERTRFVLGYRLMGEARAIQSVRMALLDKGGTIPVAISPDGRLERLPTLQQIQDHAQLSIAAAKGSRIGIALSVEPTAKPAREMDAGELAATLVQAQAGEEKVAGLFAFAVPKLTRVAFEGVAQGEAVGADGRARPLPVEKGRLVFDPAALKGAKTLRFPGAPTHVLLVPAA
jgi:hypothetical protein